MSKVLYIKSNVKPEGQSTTYQISDAFINEYKKNNPSDEVVTLDLYKENIDFLRLEDLGAMFGPKDESSKEHPLLKYAYQFLEADKYVVAAPMWNLSVPAILKAYIDYVSISGITFKYTETGAVGLCNGDRKAVFVASRGGSYSGPVTSNFEMGEKYIRTMFGFFGITDFNSVAAENMNVQGLDTNKILEEAIVKAVDLAKEF